MSDKKCAMSPVSIPTDPLDRSYSGPTLTRVAGPFAPDLFRTWRNKNGLFPKIAKDQSWKKFNFAEICAARAVYLMTQSGVAASDACLYVNQNLLSEVEKITLKQSKVRFVVIIRGPADTGWLNDSNATEFVFSSISHNRNLEHLFLKFNTDATLEQILRASTGVGIVIDIERIISAICERLGEVD